MVWRSVAVGLLVVGSLLAALGVLDFLAGLLAIDPEDEVSVAEWLVPLLGGCVLIVLGVGLLYRRPRASPPSDW